jgi:hypothetical protein
MEVTNKKLKRRIMHKLIRMIVPNLASLAQLTQMMNEATKGMTHLIVHKRLKISAKDKNRLLTIMDKLNKWKRT